MEVAFFATLRAIVGAKRVEIDLPGDARVGELVDALVARWPDLKELLRDESGGLSRRVHVFLDGRSVRWLPEGEATSLEGVESVDVFPAVAGG